MNLHDVMMNETQASSTHPDLMDFKPVHCRSEPMNCMATFFMLKITTVIPVSLSACFLKFIQIAAFKII